MFTLEMLPAAHGDALWIEYGEPDRPHRILIDAGPRLNATKQRIRSLIEERVTPRPDGDNDFELMVVTHIDADHITGMLQLMEERAIPLAPRDLWFNAFHHLPTDVLGAGQAENLTLAIRRRALTWNADFGGDAVMVPDEGPLPRIELPGGMTLTLLSPTRQELADLRPVWEREVEKAGLVPGFGMEEEIAERPADVLGPGEEIDPEALAAEQFQEDPSEANGASIAFLAEFDGRSMLLTGDAHAGVLERGIRRLLDERDEPALAVDVFKVSHHGSRHNLSPELVDLVDASRWAFSSNGRIFGHPDPVAVSRLIVGRDDIELLFNYRTEFNEPWDSSRRKRTFRYSTVFPEAGTEGLLIEL